MSLSVTMITLGLLTFTVYADCAAQLTLEHVLTGYIPVERGQRIAFEVANREDALFITVANDNADAAVHVKEFLQG